MYFILIRGDIRFVNDTLRTTTPHELENGFCPAAILLKRSSINSAIATEHCCRNCAPICSPFWEGGVDVNQNGYPH
jgi:hypothetical protein